MKTKLISVVAVAVCAAAFGEAVSLKSPDGRNEIRLTTEPALSVSVLRDGKTLLAPAPVSMTFENKGTLGGAGLKIVNTETSTRDAVIPTPVYKKSEVKDNGCDSVVTFEGGWQICLHARNDGVAYRFVTAWPDARVKVKDEQASLAFPDGKLTVYAGLTGSHHSSWESVYKKTTVGALKDEKNKLVYLPLLVQYPGGVNLCVTESDLLDYAGWNLKAATDGAARLDASFARVPDPAKVENNQRSRFARGWFDWIAETAGKRAYPWRVFITADKPEKLMEADIVYALATPNQLGDTSWVKPGKVAWEWWNCWNVFGPDVDFKAGCNTETYKYYVDFAAQTGLEYVIMDEGWSVKLKFMEINPEIDLAEIINHAAKKGVGIILWCSWPQLVGRQHEVFKKYSAMGVMGFKIDFMDRDDQFVVKFLEETARVANKYRLLVDYHGMYKPTGFHRTYPNIINYEGVHGLETAKFSDFYDMPANDLTVFFARMTAGPMDYTPGAMRYRTRNLGDTGWPRTFDAKKDKFQPNWNQPDVQGTRVHQMALMSLYEAPLQMLCDSPSQYLRNMECFRFMAAVPTVWDASVGLAGDVDKYAAAARRKGDVWYAAAIASWDGAEIEIDTSFLGDGAWEAEIFEDGPNALNAPEDYRVTTRAVKPGEKIAVKMAPGGGWTARFARPKTWSEKIQFWK